MIGNIFQFAWEVDLMVWIQSNIVNTPFMTFICILFTYLGEPVMAVAVLGFLYLGYDKELGKFVGTNALVINVVNPLIKNIFFRVRPYIANRQIQCLKPIEKDADLYDSVKQGFSLPSGHVMSIGGLTGSFYTYFKKKKYLVMAIVAITLTAISRFALGMHYPTDTIIGAALAIMFVAIFSKLQEKYSSTKILIVTALVFAVGILYCKSDDYFDTYGLLLGFLVGSSFEERYVNFKNTRNPIKIVIRLVAGVLIFLGIIEGIKIPFPDSLVNGSDLPAHIFRMCRYILGLFVCVGIYPMIFKYNILKLDDKMKDGD